MRTSEPERAWCNHATVLAVSRAMADVAGVPPEQFVDQVVRESLANRYVWAAGRKIDTLDAVAFAAGIETVLRLAGRNHVRVDWRRQGAEVHYDVRTSESSLPPPPSVHRD